MLTELMGRGVEADAGWRQHVAMTVFNSGPVSQSVSHRSGLLVYRPTNSHGNYVITPLAARRANYGPIYTLQ